MDNLLTDIFPITNSLDDAVDEVLDLPFFRGHKWER
jgi:hypothetical protein